MMTPAQSADQKKMMTMRRQASREMARQKKEVLYQTCWIISNVIFVWGFF